MNIIIITIISVEESNQNENLQVEAGQSESYSICWGSTRIGAKPGRMVGLRSGFSGVVEVGGTTFSTREHCQ